MSLLLCLAAFAGPRDELVTPEALPSWATPGGSASVDAHWWKSFDDPGLTGILEAAVTSNRDLRSVYDRTRSADNTSRQSFATLLPSATFDATASLAPTESLGFQFGGFGGGQPGAPEPPKTFWNGSAVFSAGWEPDLFLRNAENVRASRQDYKAAEADRDNAVRSFATTVVNGYLDLVTAKQRLEILERQGQATEQLLEIVELRYQAGDASAVDLLQQRQQAASVRANLPLARANMTALEQQLAVALALPPATVVQGVADTLPALPPMPDAGIPADLAQNRPDLVAAEARLDAASARKQVAMRGALPTVRLQGSVGWQFFDLTEFNSQDFWSAGASVSVPLFQGGRTLHGVQSARASEAANVHAYTQLAANAVLQVENALVLEKQRALAYEAASAQEEAARLAWEEAREQYVAGVGNYLALLTSQSTHQGAELAKLDAHRQLLGARVSLHDALGGRWAHELAETLGDRR